MNPAHPHDEHAQAEHADETHGHAELPPEPAERHITPAPEDFRNLPGPSALVWPFVWMGLAAVLIAALLTSGWKPFASEPGHGEHAEATPPR